MAGLSVLRRWCITQRDLRLRLLKMLVNFPMRVVDRMVSFPRAYQSPQAGAVINMYRLLHKVYALDVKGGSFGEVPDRNFEFFLRVCAKILSCISENDPYYRQWVGLALFLSRGQYDSLELTPEAVRRCFAGETADSHEDIPDSLIVRNMEAFKEMALCGHLSNLAQMSLS